MFCGMKLVLSGVLACMIGTAFAEAAQEKSEAKNIGEATAENQKIMKIEHELSVNPLFRDNAVIQRSATTRIFGTAKPGADVEILLGGSSQLTKADESGKWSVVADTRELRSNPYSLTVRSGKEERRYGNILIGQVFLASGQSNMEMPVG